MSTDLQRPLRVLHLERDANIAREVLNHLHSDGLHFGVLRVATRAAFVSGLRHYRPDIVVAGDAVDGACVIDLASEFSLTLPVVFYRDGEGLGGLVQGAVAQSRAERERHIAETAARHDDLRTQLERSGQSRWAQRNAEQSMHALAVAARLRELQAEPAFA